MKKLEYFLLALILLGAFFVRLYKIDNPIADWHSWRQADTAAVARNYIKDGYNFLKPQVDNYFPTNQDGLPNPQRLFLVEPPIYQTVVYVVYKIGGVHEYLARMTSVIFSLGSVVFIFMLGKRLLNAQVGLWAAFLYSFIPYSIFYGRAILPEPLMLFTSLGSLVFLDMWFEKRKISVLLIASVFAALTFLMKPYQLILLFPILYLFFFHRGKRTIKDYSLWLFLGISLVPLLFWRYYVSSHPEGIPGWTWLFNEGNIRFTGAFFNWIFAERIAKLILGYWGVFFLLVGIIVKPGKKYGWMLHLWFIGVIAYFLIIAKGNVTHDYYQVPILPVLVLFMAKGIHYILSKSDEFSFYITRLVVGVTLLFMFAFAWFHIRGFYWINRPEIIEVGKKVDAILPKDAKIIAPYGGDVAFLYHTNRHGWPLIFEPVHQMAQKGAEYLVILNPTVADFNLGKDYLIVAKDAQFVIFNLHKGP